MINFLSSSTFFEIIYLLYTCSPLWKLLSTELIIIVFHIPGLLWPFLLWMVSTGITLPISQSMVQPRLITGVYLSGDFCTKRARYHRKNCRRENITVNRTGMSFRGVWGVCEWWGWWYNLGLFWGLFHSSKYLKSNHDEFFRYYY